MHGFDYSIPRIVVTPKLISDVLRVPRESLLDYLGCHCLQIVSKDKLFSLFCKTPSSWGDRQKTLHAWALQKV